MSFEISQNKIILMKSKLRLYYSLVLYFGFSVFFYYAHVSENSKNSAWSYFFLFLFSIMVIGTISLLIMVVKNRYKDVIDCRGITIFYPFKNKLIEWKNINFVRHYDRQPCVYFDVNGKFFPLTTSAPSGMSNRAYASALLKICNLANSNKGHSLSDILTILENSKLEYKSPDKNQLLNNKIIREIKNEVKNYKHRENSLIMVSFHLSLGKYISGFSFILGLSFSIYLLLAINHGNKDLYFALGVATSISLLITILSYATYTLIYYDPTRREAYRGYSILGKKIGFRKVLENIQAVVLTDSFKQFSSYIIKITNFSDEINCKFYVTKYYAIKEGEFVAKTLGLPIQNYKVSSGRILSFIDNIMGIAPIIILTLFYYLPIQFFTEALLAMRDYNTPVISNKSVKSELAQQEIRKNANNFIYTPNIDDEEKKQKNLLEYNPYIPN